jgi:hypothetical protein
VSETGPAPEPGQPVTARERGAALAAWRALPTHVRRQVVTLSRAGAYVPDRGAAETGRRYAVAMLTPRGTSWWSRHRWDPVWTRVLVGIAALLLLAAFWGHGGGIPWADLWGAVLLAVVLLVCAGMNRSLGRTLRTLVARAPAEPDDRTGFSEERPPPA